MAIENEIELNDNQPHFVNDPTLEQDDEDLDAPGMADTDSLLAETDDSDLDLEDDDSLDLDDDLDTEDDDLDLTDDTEVDEVEDEDL
ncbi:MAG: hypothetical protein WKF66_19810 [Pedobacter sp.]